VLSGEIITIGDKTHSSPPPKSLADILAEELDGKLGGEHTQELPGAEKEKRLTAVYERIHKEQPTRSALCLSGGGIRSAAFCDGVFQALVRLDLFRQLDYISTVGTGGLVGGWAVIGQSRLQRSGGKSFPAVEINHALNPTGEEGWNRRWAFFKNVLISSIVILSCFTAIVIGLRLLTAAVVSNPLNPPGSYYGDYYGRQFQRTTVGIFVATFLLICMTGVASIIFGRRSLSQQMLRRRFLLLNILPSLAAASAVAIGWARVCRLQYFVENFKNSALLLLLVTLLFGCAFVVGWAVGLFRRNPEQVYGARRLVEGIRVTLRFISVVALICFTGSMLLILLFPDPARNAFTYVWLAPPLLTAVFMLVGERIRRDLSSRTCREEPAYSFPGWMTLIILAWLLIYGFSYLTSFFFNLKFLPVVQDTVLAFIAWGVATGLLVARMGFSASTSGRSLGNRYLGKVLLSICAVFFFLALLAAVNVALDKITWPLVSTPNLWSDSLDGFASSERLRSLFYSKTLMVAVLALIGIFVGFFVDVNRLSLQAIHRDSLRRVLRKLQQNRVKLPGEGAEMRPAVNMPAESNGGDFPVASLAGQHPFLVINLAVSFPGLDTSGSSEQVESFTISPLHCGSASIGYRPSDQYGAVINLDTALSISGSVRSPNIGYHPSRFVSAVMTLLSVRLCWWKGHPGEQGMRTWRRLRPPHVIGPLLAELSSGRLTAQIGWVNLTNGGRFDNLGLYEMIVRRCHLIVVVDAGADQGLVNEEFANAIHKVGSFLNIPIEIDLPGPTRSGDTPPRHVAVGRVRYSFVDGPHAADGLLLCVKPIMSGDEPTTLRSYAAANPEFPHEVGRDSAVTSEALENYRMLGAHSIQTFASGISPSISELFEQAVSYTQPTAAPITERPVFGPASHDAADRQIASSRAAQGLNKIFISYRREDTPDASGRIYDRLLRDFSAEYVFKDVDSIPYGLDFPNYLSGVIEQCAVCLVIIGRSWLNVTNEQGARRLDNPDDFVRIEVESALKRDIPVIPLLVQNAQMPKPAELPESLSALCRRNGTPIQGDPNFHSDMDRLVNRLKKDLQL
jgi:hypothetical protein